MKMTSRKIMGVKEPTTTTKMEIQTIWRAVGPTSSNYATSVDLRMIMSDALSSAAAARVTLVILPSIHILSRSTTESRQKAQTRPNIILDVAVVDPARRSPRITWASLSMKK